MAGTGVTAGREAVEGSDMTSESCVGRGIRDGNVRTSGWLALRQMKTPDETKHVAKHLTTK